KVNRRFCEMLGYAEHELVGEPAARFTHYEDRNKGRDFRISMWEGKLERLREQKRYLRKDGAIGWTERTVSTARDASGHPMYFIRVIEDITERVLSAQRRNMEHAVTRVLAEAADLEEAMPALIRTMCEACDWGYGAHWCWSEREGALVRMGVWSGCELAFETDEELDWTQLRWRNAAGLVGAAWFEGRPRWIADMRVDAGFRR